MAKQIDTLAQIYARSLYELAQQAGGQDKILEVGDELEQICELCRADASLNECLRSPIIDKTARSKAINKIFSDNITDLTLRFLLVLNDKGRLGHLDGIADAYDRMVQEAFGRVEVDVFTPTPLDLEQVEALKGRIQTALKREPVIYSYTDATMIGGIKLRIGDQLIDGSVATRLRRLRDQLLTRSDSALRDRLGRIIDESGSGASG